MARLQILELPEGDGDERPPFVLVIDQMPADEAALEALRRDLGFATAQQIGARAVLAFEGTIDIPANDTTAYLDAARGDLPSDARYEMTIGGKPVNWTRVDELQARAVESADERTDIARDVDRLAKWKNELLDALGMDRTRDWDDIRNAAAGIRKQRDAQGEAIERVRQESARIRATTRTWEPVADLIDAALEGKQPASDA